MLVKYSYKSAKAWAALDGTVTLQMWLHQYRWNYFSVISAHEFSCSTGEVIQSLECCVKSLCQSVFIAFGT